MGPLSIIAAMAAMHPQFLTKPCSDLQIAPIATCGTVEVPEDRAKPAGRHIKLNVIVLRATAPRPHSPPLFDLEGGPGLASTKNVEFYAGDGAAYHGRRDVVMIDQRGTGASNPLACSELGAPETAMQPLYPADAVARCRGALSSKADFTHYLTQDAVEDLDAVRQALGHDRIDLIGLSYGTTVALRYLATYPNRVRAAVLTGVAPPSAMPPASHATAGERAFRLLADQCSADAKCAKRFDLLEDFDRAVARLSAIADAPTAEIFAEKLRSMMYQPATARRIPWIVHAAAAGDLAPFRAATRQSGPSPYFDGAFLSVTCSENLRAMDFAGASKAARATRFGDYRLRRQKAACGQWVTGRAPASFLKTTNSKASVLLISGELDPVTPPDWAAAMAKRLPKARHLLIADGGHVVDGLSDLDTCYDPLIVGFLDSGDLKAVDPACLAAMHAPAFAIGASKP